MKLSMLLPFLSLLLVPLASASGECDVCKWGVRILSDSLCDQAVVENMVQTACSIIGTPDCHDTAEALVPVVIEWARENADPSMLCSAADALRQHKLLRARESTGCSMCQFVVSSVKLELEEKVLTPENVDKLKEKGYKVCDKLSQDSQDLSDSCHDLVDNYADLLIKFVDHLEPESSCAAVGLCTKEVLSRALPLQPLPAPLVRGMGALHARVQEKHNVLAVAPQELKESQMLCDNMGAATADSCKQYVDIYAPAVFAMAMGYLQAGPVCQAIQLCPPAASDKTSAAPKRPLLPGATWTLGLDKLKQRGEEVNQNEQKLMGLTKPMPKEADSQAEALKSVQQAIHEDQQQHVRETIMQQMNAQDQPHKRNKQCQRQVLFGLGGPGSENEMRL
ncbi:hypothetical protein DUNSADRAFT_14234 [Dunaliella salina]|uniref:Saposin B-type domain-containing protein n=1 Tax=Dunaliella salina TaxID=3046 RepID=A0ABQ7G7Q8_DUNSA|nr:hypothetical protein DUNSADRAFT_14234 [Dunaliella salina]|eukprot:KAF5830633.1 hypothetical protein DUNSADRAFT_14234 [Dunaliella salina]